ncbi:uncharacterized protein DSM5745_05166 [Aspergillus mulundensis]|uniref:Uncharacterized protein n=1 Tax=Aspergillus mulundensis TaxID=1810919 RepID=A0A3D8S5P1_9EURO|nr:hypothetical protein DSM5745_05166 [Aspergillus mulundensis]RDW81609.1 hypothetical protein DSM5745_05166 [Aspergillus mulundensis]
MIIQLAQYIEKTPNRPPILNLRLIDQVRQLLVPISQFRPDQADKLPSAEIMMQVRDEIAGPGRKDGVKWIVRSHIVNEGTIAIMQEAKTKYGWQDKSAVRVTKESNMEAFEALSGTPNCKGIYPTLATHDLRRTGSWRVTELLVWIGGTPYNYIAMEIEQA